MNTLKGVISNSVLICIHSYDRRLLVESAFRNQNLEVISTSNVTEGLAEVEHKLPHLIVVDSILGSEDAGVFYDRLKKNAIQKRIPIFLLIGKKSKENIMPLAGRKFDAVFLGIFQAKPFLDKVFEILGQNPNVSPFFFSIENRPRVNDKALLTVEAQYLGKNESNLVLGSPVEISRNEALTIRLRESLVSLTVSGGTNTVHSSRWLNIFPLSKVQSQSTSWQEFLPADELPAGLRLIQTLVACDPDNRWTDKISSALEEWNIRILATKTLGEAVNLIRVDPEKYGCLYLHGLDIAAEERLVLRSFCEMRAAHRPIMLVGGDPPRSVRVFSFENTPLGIYVRRGPTAEELCQYMGEAAKAVASPNDSSAIGHKVLVQFSARILGFDESGVVLGVNHKLAAGVNIKIASPAISALNSDSDYQILKARSSEDGCQIYLRLAASLEAKSSYYERVMKTFGLTDNNNIAA